MRLGYSLIALCILTGCLNNSQDNPTGDNSHTRIYDLEIRHPSFPEGQLQQKKLLVHLDEKNRVLSYEMEVDSVICLETKCEIIPVRLHWDVLGQFIKYELPDGGELTKKDHIVFSDEDYQKLNRILGDRRSFLKVLKSEQIVNPEKAVRTADGISAPTPVSMQQAVVAGAAYTCYTLWHWVNGEVSDRILELTAGQITVDQLVDLYITGKESYVEFAIDQLITRHVYEPEVIDAIAHKMQDDEDVVKPALRYLTEASIDQQSPLYFETIDQVFLNSGKSGRIRILESLITSSLEIPDGFYDRISRFLPNLESYYEVHLLLELEARHNPHSSVVNKQAVSLLDHENFLIARRAFWFLEERKLNPDQSALVDSFRKKYADRI